MAEEEKKKKEPSLKNMRCEPCRSTFYSFMKGCPHCGAPLKEVQIETESYGAAGLHDPMDYTY